MPDHPDPDETGFDAELRALAVRIMDEEAVPAGRFGRAWDEHGLFTAMQSYAAVAGGDMVGLLARCEALGRQQARALRAEAT